MDKPEYRLWKFTATPHPVDKATAWLLGLWFLVVSFFWKLHQSAAAKEANPSTASLHNGRDEQRMSTSFEVFTACDCQNLVRQWFRDYKAAETEKDVIIHVVVLRFQHKYIFDSNQIRICHFGTFELRLCLNQKCGLVYLLFETAYLLPDHLLFQRLLVKTPLILR